MSAVRPAAASQIKRKDKFIYLFVDWRCLRLVGLFNWLALPCCLLGGLWAGGPANGSAQRRQAKAREQALPQFKFNLLNLMEEEAKQRK